MVVHRQASVPSSTTRPSLNLKWLDTINRVTQTGAKWRLTYLGNPKPQLADHLHDPVTASRDLLAVISVDLNYLLCRESGTDDVPPGTIPSLIERCLIEIETPGLKEVGICEDPIDSSTDIHAVYELVKSWFRVLPESLFPSNSYHLVIDAMPLPVMSYKVYHDQTHKLVKTLIIQKTARLLRAAHKEVLS
ncbi:hypothetical protein K438DRAFT_1928107 [Mycena galopus ATCC 62051]|nr:hypothetical protein K438DRAFT_1928107 [Mycena galopus ATCC 62051]